MAQPKVRIADPTYTTKEVISMTGFTLGQLAKAVNERDLDNEGNLYWPEVAKLVVAQKVLQSIPVALLSPGNQQRIIKFIMDGPTPKAGTCLLRADGSVYYLSTGLTSNHQGISVKWDGTLQI